ncbi:cytochrome bc1 complex cytochrome b subunit [Arthrobacter sp. TMN-37]
MKHPTSFPNALTSRLGAFAQSQTHYRTLVKRASTAVVPRHWSFMFAEVAAYSFVVLAVTGAFLTFFYNPSAESVRYSGPYAPLAGVEISKALESTLRLSFEVRGGLLIRQMHHWSALLFMAALTLHILRIFFTGAFRTPRETAWVVLIGIFLAGLGTGLTGYILPDDLLSGSSLLILDGTLKAVPVIGSSLSYLVFGGPYPGDVILARLNTLHVVILPLLVIGLAVLRAVLGLIHKPMQFPAPGRSNDNIVGEPLPTRAVKSAGLLFAIAGFTALIGATVTINPIWNYGPADPGNAGAGSQPDWYLGFVDGALRLVPPGWDLEIFGGTLVLPVLIPMAGIGGFFAAVVTYPFLERWIRSDTSERHLLERPRNNPTRTGIGVAGMTFGGVLWAAGSADVTALYLSLSFEDIIYAYRVLVLAGPFIAFSLTRRICLALQRKDRELLLHGRETGRIVRLPHGEYIEVHQPLNRYEQWALADFEPSSPVTDDAAAGKGARLVLSKVRHRISDWFFENRLEPSPPQGLDHPAAGQPRIQPPTGPKGITAHNLSEPWEPPRAA